MALYIGTNYHPHDWKRESWETDIDLMKKAGFTVVRLGHLCWDSYEPADGVYTFEWFDEVMNLFERAGIKVFLDISMRPAPLWVHRECPGCDIFTKSGIRQTALTRYMEDVDDSDYQFYAFRFAKKIVNRYKEHPALMAFGLCNEQGAGFLSFSEGARKRFGTWLLKKYGTIEKLNTAWNTQRWSRRISSFEEVVLPQNEMTKGAPESYLDMRRFFGDGVLNFMKELKAVVEQEAPGIPHSSNHVAEGDVLGFDYLKGCADFVDYPGIGFYPDIDTEDEDALMYALMFMQHRLAELNKPMWCIEFQTGNFGGYAGKNGILRMYALLCLVYRSQMALAWTWRSMLGGEEQFFFGLLDHDGTCSSKYEEFAQIASDYKKLEAYGFPYLPEPEAAIAYCYENNPIYQYGTCYYRTSYKKQIVDTMKIFYRRNLDCNIVDVKNMKGNYHILIMPGHAIMTHDMAKKVRNFVAEGGTVIMTAYSAKVNENNTVFDTAQPGFLADVFGIRIAGFERTGVRPVKEWEKEEGKQLCVSFQGGQTVTFQSTYFEEIEIVTAEVFASYRNENQVCAVSVNAFGNGKAYYTSAETNEDLLGVLYDNIAAKEGLNHGIKTEKGVVARNIRDKEWLYVNTTSEEKVITLAEPAEGVLQGNIVENQLILPPFGGELLVEIK